MTRGCDNSDRTPPDGKFFYDSIRGKIPVAAEDSEGDAVVTEAESDVSEAMASSVCSGDIPGDEKKDGVFYDSIRGKVVIDDDIPAPTAPVTEPIFWPFSGDVASREPVAGLEEIHQIYESGLLQNFRKDYTSAIASLERASSLYATHGYPLGGIFCIIELGWIRYAHDQSGDGLSKSAHLFSEAAKMIHAHPPGPDISEAKARLLHYQGLVMYRQKNYGEAVRNFMYAKSHARPDGAEAAGIYDSLAVHYEHTNDYYRSIQCLHAALTLKQRNGRFYEQAQSRQILGRIHIVREEYDKASEHLHQALRIACEIGDLQRIAKIKNDLIRLHIYQGDMESALRLITEIREECLSKDLRVPYGTGLFYLAYIHFSHSNLDESQALLETEVLPIFNKYGYRKGQAMARRFWPACITARIRKPARLRA